MTIQGWFRYTGGMPVCTARFLDRDHEPSAGMLPETFFKCSAVTEWHFPWPEKTYERVATEVRLAWSAKFLYVHFWSLDSYFFARETKPKGKVQLDDYVGVTLAHGGLCRGWLVNPVGALAEFSAPYQDAPLAEADLDRSWKSAALSKTGQFPAGWSWEIRIPFEKDFSSTPSRGDTWKVQFHRQDIDKQGHVSRAEWAAPRVDTPGILDPGSFGDLQF